MSDEDQQIFFWCSKMFFLFYDYQEENGENVPVSGRWKGGATSIFAQCGGGQENVAKQLPGGVSPPHCGFGHNVSVCILGGSAGSEGQKLCLGKVMYHIR